MEVMTSLILLVGFAPPLRLGFTYKNTHSVKEKQLVEMKSTEVQTLSTLPLAFQTALEVSVVKNTESRVPSMAVATSK